MKKTKLFLLISSALTLLPILVGVLLWNRLPEQMAIHWGISGDADGFSARALAVFVPPLFMFAMHLFSFYLVTRDKNNEKQSGKVLGMILWICPLMSLYTGAVIYTTAFGMEFDMSRGMLAVLGLMFLVFGNYLPKCQMNHTVGVRIPWVYTSEENWERTHRVTGKLWFACGFVCLLVAFLPSPAIPYILLAILIPMALVPVIYSYRFYRKQVESGEIPKKIPTRMSKTSKRIKIFLIVFLVLVFVFVDIMMLAGNFETELRDDSLYIDATFWSDFEIAYADIEHIELRETDHIGSRTLGYGDVRVCMGTFENGEFGSYTRYSHKNSKTAIVLTVKGKTVVLNGEDESATKELYLNILEALGANGEKET